MSLQKQIMDLSLESFCSCDVGHLDWGLPELSNCNALDIVRDALYSPSWYMPCPSCLFNFLKRFQTRGRNDQDKMYPFVKLSNNKLNLFF